MRNKSLIISLAGAAVFGLVAAVSITRYLSSTRAYTNSLVDMAVASQHIPLGTKITRGMLTTTRMPKGELPEGAFDDLTKVEGRVAITDIGVRDPVTAAKLATEGAAGGLTAVIPDGYRAMTVKVDDVVGVSGFIMPGSFVDVVAVISPPDQSGQNPISKVVLQNIKVLANGQNIDLPKDERDATSVKAVTLQVTPDDAETLALAANEGKLQLVLRNFGDQQAAETSGASKRSVLTGEPVALDAILSRNNGQAPAPSPTPSARLHVTYDPPQQQVRPAQAAQPAAAQQPAPPVRSVELIEGTKKQSVAFPD